MNFGVGVGDVVVLAGLAWKLYKACKDASDEFRQASADIMSLHAVLHETEDLMREQYGEGGGLETSRAHRLQMLCDGCRPPLEELEGLVQRYDSLGTQAQRTWDRLRFGMKDLSDVRSRLVCSTTLLNAFNIALINSSTARIERKLNKFMAEVQAGLREGSVVTTNDVAQTLDSPPVWDEFRRELEDVGISAVVVEENRKYIASWIRDALAEGMLEESAVSDKPLVEGEQRRPSQISDASIAGAGTNTVASAPGIQFRTPVFSDSGYGGSVDGRHPSTSTASASISEANEQFELQLRQRRQGGGIEDRSKSLSAMSTSSSASYTVKPRRRRDIGKLLQSMVVKDKVIIEAASDGDAEKVAELIGLGVNVNARDRWGWSAMSMCAYGGYLEIARMLLDHGADLDNIDVDGDTPTTLAASRGHTDLVVLLDEVRAMRDLQLREADAEVPRRVDV